MSSFKYRVLKQTFYIAVTPVADGIWTRFVAMALCPLCRNELNFGITGRRLRETEAKSNAKAGAKKHLQVVHHLK